MKLAASDDLIREHALLIARGTRALALIGTCQANHDDMLHVATKIETLACSNAIPFVLDRGDGTAEYGYAAARWVLDIFQWVIQSSPDSIPSKQRDRIIGLLCGYGVEAIRLFEEQTSGRLFQKAILSDVPTANLQHDGNHDMAEKSRPC